MKFLLRQSDKSAAAIYQAASSTAKICHPQAKMMVLSIYSVTATPGKSR
jgi:hypothetical protein